MATAFKRGDKWRIQPSKTLPDGSRVRTSITADTKKEAERLAAIWESDMNSQTKTHQTITVGECFDKYFETCKSQKLSPSYLRWQKAKKSAYTLLINIQVRKLSVQDIQKYINQRCDAGIQPSVVKSEITLLKCVLLAYASHIDFTKLKLPKVKKRKKKEFKDSWKHDIPAKIIELYGKKDMYLYILLIIYAGLRPSESYALTFGDISDKPTVETVNNNEIKIGHITVNKASVRDENNIYQEKDPKSDAGYRTIEVSWYLIEQILELHPRTKAEDRILQIKPVFTVQWKAVKKALNLPDDLRMYDMRHFFATSKILAGATEEELQTDMGHSNSAFTHSVYVEIMEDHKQKANRTFVKQSAESLSELKNFTASKDTHIKHKENGKGSEKT